MIGIVGVGRLGTVLAARLNMIGPILVHDLDPAAERRACRLPGITVSSMSEMAARVDVVLICTPDNAIVGLLEELAMAELARPVYAILATAITAERWAEIAHISRLRVVAVKVIGQFTAIECGLPALFVTESKDKTAVSILRNVLSGLGPLVQGPEDMVRHINRLAATQALIAGRLLNEYCRSLELPTAWAEAAVKNVLVGTLLDYPPHPDNGYTNAIMTELVDASTQNQLIWPERSTR
jgi:pyrroline-5-carboxylate reductase